MTQPLCQVSSPPSLLLLPGGRPPPPSATGQMSTATPPPLTSPPSTSTPPPSPVFCPSELDQIFQLKSLAIQKNSLSGTLPSFENKSILTKTTSHLEINNLGPWQIPSYLAESTNLVTFYASNASITGIVPDIFGYFPNLLNLRLSYNNLTGSLPGSFSGSEIRNLWLNNQKQGLSGRIDVLGNMVQLEQAWLHANMFSGGIPDISRCTSLFDLQLRDNRFTGVVPPSLMILPNLVNITLQNNKLQADLGYPVSLAESWQGNNACADWRFISCDSQGRNVTVVNMASALTSLPQLQIVDLSSNNLSGPLLVFPSSVRFIYGGNLLLGRNETSGGAGGSIRPKGLPSGSSSGSRKRSGSAAMIAGVIVAVLVFIGVVFFVSYKCYVKRRHKRFGRVEGSELRKELVKPSGANGYGGVPSELQSQSSGDHSEIPNFEGGNVTISIQVLRQVTNNFSEENVLGRGGFGVVYKGELHDRTKIAVKRMESGVMGTKGLNEFQAEIALLTKVRHRHLVALLGYCINGNERLLVYEYMPQGTLSQHLFEWQEHGYVARVVEYLHGLAQQSFIHRDLKPTNILLTDDMRAKVGDFGLVKNAPDGKYSVETRLAGTFGYLAPEYAVYGKGDNKS
ncbi:hypothetical protein OROHE_014917 [Orobanche hederae]